MPNAQEQMDPRPLDIIELTDPKAPFKFVWVKRHGSSYKCLYIAHTSNGYRIENSWEIIYQMAGSDPVINCMERTRFQSQFIVSRVSMGVNLANELLDSFLRSRSSCR